MFLNDVRVRSEDIDGNLICIPLPVTLTGTGVDGYDICAKLTTDQVGGGLQISKSVTIEASLRANILFGAVTTPELPFTQIPFEWKCLNVPLAIGLAVGIFAALVILCIILCYCKSMKTKAQSREQSNHV